LKIEIRDQFVNLMKKLRGQILIFEKIRG